MSALKDMKKRAANAVRFFLGWLQEACWRHCQSNILLSHVTITAQRNTMQRNQNTKDTFNL